MERINKYSLPIMTVIEKRDLALNLLKLELDQVVMIDGGINNNIYRLRNNLGEKFCLKIYNKQTTRDGRDRQESESKFLEYTEKYCGDMTPRIIRNNKDSGWILMEWIDGDKLKSLNEESIEEIGEFIYRLNRYTNKERKLLDYAAEYLNNHKTLVNNINKRIRAVEQNTYLGSANKDASTWVSSVIVNKLEKLVKENQRDIEIEFNKNTKRDLIASPSDIGIHNIIKTDKGLKFIDFEYSGRDDICKLVADLVLQPRHKLNKQKEESVIISIDRSTEEERGSWQKRYELVKPLIIVKWCMIMLNKAGKGIVNQEYVEKAMEYFYDMNEE